MSDLPYPSEQIQLQMLMDRIREETGTRRDIEGFATEIIERFATIGWHVSVTTATASSDPDVTTMFEVDLLGRIDPTDIDHDRMSHEVQHDVAGTGMRGAITADGTVIEPATSTSMPGMPGKPDSN